MSRRSRSRAGSQPNTTTAAARSRQEAAAERAAALSTVSATAVGDTLTFGWVYAWSMRV